MKTITVMVNGFEISVSEELVGLDVLENNSSNPREREELEKNGKRIYLSMFPEIGENRVDRFRQDKFSMYCVKNGKSVKTLTGNSSLVALRLWSEEYPESFLARFPARMIPVSMCAKLTPLETLAVISDHSDGYRPEKLSKMHTAGQVRRSMALRKKPTVATVCSDLGYSPGMAKPYFALETARLNNTELHDVLYEGAIEGDNLIKLSQLPQLAALWTPSKGRTDLPSDPFGQDNVALWQAVLECRDFGKIGATEKALSPLEKSESEVLRLKAGVEMSKTFNDSLSTVTTNEAIQEMLDAVILGDIAKVRVLAKQLAKSL